SKIHDIHVITALPAITDTVVIDGYTQPGASANTLAIGDNAVILIELDGSGISAGADGLTINADDTTVRGLNINRFKRGTGNNGGGGNGIVAVAQGAVITGNFIGTNAPANFAFGNDFFGIEVQGPNAVIGGTDPADRNVISGNGEAGIDVTGDGAV